MIPRLVVAGTHSGCGKTTVACGIMAALTARGLSVQPFKAGPDFIDPSHHTAICGRVSRNLDPFMMGEEGVRRTFAQAVEGADIAVIEGAMGMYDGMEGSDVASTAHIARLLEAPVVLVVDVQASSRSANAVVLGFAEYDPRVRLAASIFNRVAGPRHREMIETGAVLPAAGWLPRHPTGTVGSRHLGLEMAHETDRMAAAGALTEEHCDLEMLVSIAKNAPEFAFPAPGQVSAESEDLRVAVARDASFCFYYQDNLDWLRSAGAQLVFFSPVTERLPDADALYLGGGYPELNAPALSASRCRDDIRKAAADGMPVYAECGGLMYLAESLSAGGVEYPMAAVLPARAMQTERLQALGYVEASGTGVSALAPVSLSFRGHEFHYSAVESAPDARFGLCLSRGKGIGDGRDGLCEWQTLGGYTHAYFTPEFAENFVAAAASYRRR